MTPPTPITPAMQAIIDERVRMELKKKLPKKLIPLGRILPSRDHDFEAQLVFYKTDSNGKLITETKNGKTGYVFDYDSKTPIISTVAMQLFLDALHRGEKASILVSTEEDE